MLDIRGFQKTSLIDYPGKISSIIFLPKCNMGCPYCQNPDLVVNYKDLPKIREDEIIRYLKSKKEWIDAIVITGGEPTLHKELSSFLRRIKETSLLVKLDTNGTNPEMIKDLINKKLVDYIAMDIKAPLDKYEDVAKTKVNKENIQKSIDIIRNSGINYEFRLTCAPSLISEEDIIKIGEWLKGSKRFYLQQFRNKATLDKSFEKEKPYSKGELDKFKEILEEYIEYVEVRNV